MSRRNNDTVDLSSTNVEKISCALYMIKDIEERIKSIVFQNNVGVLNFGGSCRTQISLNITNLPFQLISTTDLDNLNLEIDNLRVN
jgi:hypothetical protein